MTDDRLQLGRSCSTTSSSTSATSPRRSARSRAAGTTSAQEAVVVNGKWKAIPFGNIGQLMNWRTDWFKRGRASRQVPRHLGRASTRPASSSRRQGPSVRLRARPRLRRQPRLALSAAVVLRRPRGRGRRQDRRHRFRRDRARRRLLPQVLQGDHARGLPRLDRRQQQQGVPVGADLLHQQRREHPVVRPSATSRTSAKVTDQAMNPQGPKGRFHLLNPHQPFDLQLHARTRRRPRPSCAG